MQYKPTCKKKRGSPRITWFDGIKEVMEKREIEEEWSLDRPRCREAIENGRRRQTARTVDR